MMKQNVSIEYLLNKFRKNTLSQEELDLLKSYFKKGQPDKDLIAYFDKVWNDRQRSGDSFDLEENFAKIKSRLNIDDGTRVLNYQRLIIRLISYAAVFMLGIGLYLLYTSNKSKTILPSGKKFVTVNVPYGSKSKVELPDGSKVTLNSGSYLKYPVNFGTKIRNVEFEGEAYFNISKNKKVPFIVSTSGIYIKVLGTKFNVKSYPEDKNIETTLITGSVEIFNDKNITQPAKHIWLKPNQKISIPKKQVLPQPQNKASYSAPVNKVPIIPAKAVLETNINTADYTAWKDDKLVFDNERFYDIMLKMERWYGVFIHIHSPEINDDRFSGIFEKETLQEALQALALIAPIRFKIHKNQVDIYKRPN